MIHVVIVPTNYWIILVKFSLSKNLRSSKDMWLNDFDQGSSFQENQFMYGINHFFQRALCHDIAKASCHENIYILRKEDIINVDQGICKERFQDSYYGLLKIGWSFLQAKRHNYPLIKVVRNAYFCFGISSRSIPTCQKPALTLNLENKLHLRAVGTKQPCFGVETSHHPRDDLKAGNL